MKKRDADTARLKCRGECGACRPAQKKKKAEAEVDHVAALNEAFRMSPCTRRAFKLALRTALEMPTAKLFAKAGR